MRKSAIIIGKILPYLFIALVVELLLFALGQGHFHTKFRNRALLLALSLVFLLSTSGLGALISSFSRTQTQAIQFSVFFLLPVFLLSGAFAPGVATTFRCQALFIRLPTDLFLSCLPREINIYSGGIVSVTSDLLLLGFGVLVTCSIAAYRLRQSEE